MNIILMEDVETIECKLCGHECSAVDAVDLICDECYDDFHAEVPLREATASAELRYEEE